MHFNRSTSRNLKKKRLKPERPNLGRCAIDCVEDEMNGLKKTLLAFVLTIAAETLALWIVLALSDGFNPVAMMLSAIAVLLFIGIVAVIYVGLPKLQRT
jgi:NO-binding membrane sensor protein with MHYT domain